MILRCIFGFWLAMLALSPLGLTQTPQRLVFIKEFPNSIPDRGSVRTSGLFRP
jgi:hypothetical protein